MTGALFFKQGVNLYIEDGATLMGSDNISDYPVCETRIEGETCQYFAALLMFLELMALHCAVMER